MKASLIDVERVSETELEQCFSLLQDSFEGVSKKSFFKDLSEKEKIILLEDDSRVVGFSTIMSFPLQISSGTIEIVFSGDTAVDPAARNSREIGRCLAEYLFLAMSRSLHPVWYVLISKGWRTYRAMWFLFKQAYPQSDEDVLLHEYQGIVRAFRNHKYPDRQLYNDSVLVGQNDAQCIRSGSDDLTVRAGESGEIFTTLNPGYATGDELVCIAHVCKSNMTPSFFRCQPKKA